MADHGTVVGRSVGTRTTVTDYQAGMVAIPADVVRTKAQAVKDVAGGYRIAGTETGDEPIERVQWFPRGDWQNDGE